MKRLHKRLAIFGIGCTFALVATAHDSVQEYQEKLERCSAIPSSMMDFSPFEACRSLLQNGYGDADVHFYMGRILYLNANVDRALEHFRTAAASGSAKAVTALAYHRGLTSTSEQQAPLDPQMVALFERAVEMGDPVAAVLLANELGINGSLRGERDLEKEQMLLEGASEQGFAPAHFFLALFYRSPKTANPGPEVSIDLLEQAAQGGVRRAAEALAAEGHDISAYGDLDSMRYQYIGSSDLVLRRP
ncbi:hypothetical protein QQM79_14580 [Marinobacteraceae bacterium S3BR75-40.1]